MESPFKDLYRKLPLVRDLRASQQGIDTIALEVVQLLQYIRQGQRAEQLQALLDRERYRDPRRLNRHEYQVHSQHGEDGIIAEIFRRIGAKDRTFLEVGVGDGLENNTAYLLLQGWSGCWVEGFADSARAIRENLDRRLSDGSLKLVETFVTAEEIGPLLKSRGVPDELDLISLDIDRNTYYLWEALGHIRARVAVIEYNPKFPPPVDWRIPYSAREWWDGTFYYGASLKAYEHLGRRLGYRLVGCDVSGTNAFFVREDLCGDAFLGPDDAETHYEPPRPWLWTSMGEKGKIVEPRRDRRGYAGLNQ